MGVVRSVDAAGNHLHVELADGSAVQYDPRRLYGVNVYRETSREFATGDRLQFSGADKKVGIANRDLGTTTGIKDEQITVRMDAEGERSITIDATKFRQFDHGYAVTSHSSQGLAAGRVIAHMDTDSSRSLINTRLAYVAISRASDDARIYTNDAATLGSRLATEVMKTAAVDFRSKEARTTPESAERAQPQNRPSQTRSYEFADAKGRIAEDYASKPERSVVIAPDTAGERIQFTAPDRGRGIRKGDFGTVESIADNNTMAVRLDNGKVAELSPEKARHIDYGYAVDGSHRVAADRILATGDGIACENLNAAHLRTSDVALYTSRASRTQHEELSDKSQPSISELPRLSGKQQQGFGVGF